MGKNTRQGTKQRNQQTHHLSFGLGKNTRQGMQYNSLTLPKQRNHQCMVSPNLLQYADTCVQLSVINTTRLLVSSHCITTDSG